MSDVPQTAQLLTSPSTVVWSDGKKFDGYVWIGVTLPTTPAGFDAPYLWASQRRQDLPPKCKVPIVNGVIDSTTQLFYNANMNPPGTQYVAYYFSQDDVLIAPASGTATPFSVTASPHTLTVPTLTIPSTFVAPTPPSE